MRSWIDMCRSRMLVLAAALVAFSGFPAAKAQVIQEHIKPVPTSPPGVTAYDFLSRTGIPYRVSIYRPASPAPAQGFPVFYVLDGNAYFGTTVESSRIQSARPNLTGVHPAIVVGIGYPTDALFDSAARERDLVPERQSAKTSENSADRFLKFIKEELIPFVDKEAGPIDARRRTLFGHSSGGQFVLYALFREPQLFSNYLAASPSIFAKERSVLDYAGLFQSHCDPSRPPAVQISNGGYEHRLSPTAAASPEAKDLRGKMRTYRQIEYSREVADLLRRSRCRPRVDNLLFRGETHVSVVPMSISRGIRFAAGVPAETP